MLQNYKIFIDGILCIHHKAMGQEFRLSLCISEDRDSELIFIDLRLMRVTSTIFPGSLRPDDSSPIKH